MKQTKARTRIYGGLFVLILGSFTLLVASFSRGPDFVVHFVREVPSEQSVDKLGQAISAISNWPNWFYSTVDAKILDAAGRPYPLAEQVAMQGAVVKLSIDPKRGKWKKFDLLLQITEYIPNRKIRFHFLDDSKKKINNAFDSLDWQIELIPSAGGRTLLRGEAWGHTCNWKSRFFGRVADRSLMNQVYYPNLIELAGVTQPLRANPLLPTQQ